MEFLGNACEYGYQIPVIRYQEAKRSEKISQSSPRKHTEGTEVRGSEEGGMARGCGIWAGRVMMRNWKFTGRKRRGETGQRVAAGQREATEEHGDLRRADLWGEAR
jgi:hypothetical protein